MRLLRIPLSLLVSLVLLASLFSPTTASADSLKKKDFNYVALGDSLAAGVTPYNKQGPGYPHYLAEQLKSHKNEVNSSFFGVPGYKTTDVLSDLTNPSRPLYTPLKTALSHADIVTIDIGANDILNKLLTGKTITPEDLNVTLVNIASILAIIKQINPEAQIYVMGYYNPFPHPDSLYAPYVLALLNALDIYNHSVEILSLSMDATYVPTAVLIQENYSTYLPNPNNIHLSMEGYQAVANAFWKAIKKDKQLLISKK